MTKTDTEKHPHIVEGRKNARRIADVDAFESVFVPWSGCTSYTWWENKKLTKRGLSLGTLVANEPFLETVNDFVEYSKSEATAKGEGRVMVFGETVNGNGTDDDAASVTWLFLDDDAAGDLREFLELLQAYGVAFIAQRRGVKWHLHIPLAQPILIPQPYDPAFKPMHVARMEWVTGIFSELANLKDGMFPDPNDLQRQRRVYGFDAAIPNNKILGLCYPYTRVIEQDEYPETIHNEGLALDIERLLAVTAFEWHAHTGKARVIALEEVQGRQEALSLAGLVRNQRDDGHLDLVCPWSTDKTKNGHEPGAASSTILFPSGTFHCSHETCKPKRYWSDIDLWLEENAPEARTAAWLSQIIRNDKGTPKASINNALVILENDSAWRGALRYDARACRVIMTKDPPWRGDRTYNDAFITRTSGWLAKRWNIEGHDLTARAIEAVARAHSFDPVAEYLEGLRWDGVPRMNEWLTKYLGADDDRLNRELGRMWLISACMRGVSPGCQVDHVLVLEGTQGLAKTSAFRALGGEWFSEITTTHGVASMENLQGAWILEMGELAATKKNDIETLKSFITRIDDKYRAAYGRVSENHPRRCVFGGTTNENEYLEDTKNRRFWPVKIRRVDREGIERDRDQLFAEAMVQVRAGATWHITDEDIQQRAEVAQEARRYVNPWEDKIAAYLSGLTVTTMHKVMQIALGIETKDQARSYKNVGRIVSGLGWETRRLRHNGRQDRFLVRAGLSENEIRWADLGGPTLALVKGGDGVSPVSVKTE